MNKTVTLITAILIAVFFASCSNPVMSTDVAATEMESEAVPEDSSEALGKQKSEASENVEEVEESLSVKDSEQGDSETGESESEKESDKTEPGTDLTEAESSPEKSDSDIEEDNEEEESEDETSSTNRPEWAKARKWDKIDWNGFDWQNMALQEVLDYLGIKGKHLGWDK